MLKTYRSEYPNQVHQLCVSVSKHYYILKSGSLKYQVKKQEINFEKLGSSERSHVVHYVLRDHCTGLCYAEIGLSNDLIPIQDFLYRAWAEEKDYSFYGIPELLAIPETVEKKFPNLRERVTSLGIGLIKVTSGFQGGGGRDIKTIEEYMKFCDGSPIERAKIELRSLWRYLNTNQKSRNGKDTKFELWHNNISSVYIPKKEWLEEFENPAPFSIP